MPYSPGPKPFDRLRDCKLRALPVLKFVELVETNLEIATRKVEGCRNGHGSILYVMPESIYELSDCSLPLFWSDGENVAYRKTHDRNAATALV